ncbi:MAG: hypothetical protein NT062_29565 [Proteobacteria bacterium]|nr:hypothetical protein [Pseudomonadota bacterium]
MERFAGLLALGACISPTDERPITFDVIQLEILAPSCGVVQCHSSTTRFQGYVFDSFDESRRSLRNLIVPDSNGVFGLVQVMTRSSTRMPIDAPLPHDDLVLIESWLEMDTPGL